MKTKQNLLTLALGCAFATALSVQSAELGMQAPLLGVKEWIKGTPVTLEAGKGKNIYVVEFWATWCGPCRVSIPHLTDMQAKFKDRDVVFIGVSDETSDKVRPFVDKMGDKMNYTVAIDDNDKTSKGYMTAFGVNGIPHAFVVDKSGAIVWHGHPMAGLEQTLQKIIDGKYNMEKAKKAAGAEQLVQKYFMAASTGQKGPELDKMGKQIVEDGADNPALLNEFSWAILTNKKIKTRDLPLALAAAKQAYDGSEGKDAGIADTYARALFDNGKVPEAITMQKKALEICKDDRLKEDLEKALKRYAEQAGAKQ